MPEVLLFVEDEVQETYICALCERIAAGKGLHLLIQPRSVRGGYGRLRSELRKYAAGVAAGRESAADYLIVVADGNCRGANERRLQLIGDVGALADRTVLAIPDPHIERWLLLDGAAFQRILGRGCQAPDYKCEKGRYKKLLSEAVRAAGAVPLLGGAEYAEDLARACDIVRLRQADREVERFADSLEAGLDRWRVNA